MRPPRFSEDLDIPDRFIIGEPDPMTAIYVVVLCFLAIGLCFV